MSTKETESMEAPEKQPSSADIERQQEKLLQSKYGNMKPKAGSSFAQRRLNQKGNKYFDSGDYNMAKAKMGPLGPQKVTPKQLNQVTGDHMPTPDELPRVRKASQSSLVVSHSS